jgi:hypothetical protein
LAVADATATVLLTKPVIATNSRGVLAEWGRLGLEHQPSLNLAELGGLTRKAVSPFPPSNSQTLPPFWGLKHTIVRAPLLSLNASMRNSFHTAWNNTPKLIDAATGPRRVWFSPQATDAPVNQDTFSVFRDRTEELGSPPMIVHTRQEMVERSGTPAGESKHAAEAIKLAPAAERIDVDLLRYTPNELAFRVNCPSDGWLAVTDRWTSGWTATVNGESTPVSGGMYIFRAVPVKAGMSEIDFVYRPWGYPWLAVVSYATMAAVGIAAIRFRKR